MLISQLIDNFLEARRTAYLQRDRYVAARELVLQFPEHEVMAEMERRLISPDEDDRCRTYEAMTLLYRCGVIPSLIGGLSDPSSTVRWVCCGCLHDFGDESAIPALLERLRTDEDCQVRGEAVSALGRCGTVEILPVLEQCQRTDHAVDPLGHSPSSQALQAITTLLQRWVIHQIAGNPALQFREQTASGGSVKGIVTAVGIPFDPEGRLTCTPRYRGLPHSAFGPGCATQLDLQTSLQPPFEISVTYLDSGTSLRRVFVFHPLVDVGECNWAIHTLLNPGVWPPPG